VFGGAVRLGKLLVEETGTHRPLLAGSRELYEHSCAPHPRLDPTVALPAVLPCRALSHTCVTHLSHICPTSVTHSEDVNYDAFGRDLQSFFTELESLNSSLVLTADPTAGETGSETGSSPHSSSWPVPSVGNLCLRMACVRQSGQAHPAP
jgi:hypothetical protein